MKINVASIPPEGITRQEDIAASELDIETSVVKFRRPIRIKAAVYKITNTVTVDVNLSTLIHASCSRCLNELEIAMDKDFKLNYTANKLEPAIDLNPDIRDEIILDYPIKPLCSPDCKGLCNKCGKNLNDEKCNCK